MVERLRGFRKIAGTAVLAASLSACSQSPDNQPIQTPVSVNTHEPQIVTPEPTKTPIFTTTPEKTPIPTPEPTPIVEKTPAEKAREAMLNSWLYTLNSGIQENADEQYKALKVEATNLSTWQSQEDLILNGGQSSEVLKVSWAGGSYVHGKGNNGNASKYFGQIEINNAQIISQGGVPLTDADMANEMSWREYIKISYIERIHSKDYLTAQGNYEKLKSWVTTFDNKDLPAFSPWQQTSYEGEVILQNGQWRIQLSQSSSRRAFVNSINGFTIPYSSQVIALCADSCEDVWQTINIK